MHLSAIILNINPFPLKFGCSKISKRTVVIFSDSRQTKQLLVIIFLNNLSFTDCFKVIIQEVSLNYLARKT